MQQLPTSRLLRVLAFDLRKLGDGVSVETLPREMNSDSDHGRLFGHSGEPHRRREVASNRTTLLELDHYSLERASGVSGV